jgi:hypothetical protein
MKRNQTELSSIKAVPPTGHVHICQYCQSLASNKRNPIVYVFAHLSSYRIIYDSVFVLRHPQRLFVVSY